MTDTSVVMLTHEQWEEYRRNNRWSKRFAVITLCLLIVVIGVVGALALDNHDVLSTIRFNTSPSHVKSQQRQLNEILVHIDCNNRRANQDTINALAAQGLIQPVDITQVCRKG